MLKERGSIEGFTEEKNSNLEFSTRPLYTFLVMLMFSSLTPVGDFLSGELLPPRTFSRVINFRRNCIHVRTCLCVRVRAARVCP